MPPMPRTPFSLRLIPAIAATTLVLAGCSSTSRRDRFQHQAITARPAVAMRGEGLFFDGKLKAEVTVTRGRTLPSGEEAGGPGGGRGHHRGGRGRWHRDESMMSDTPSDDSDSPVHPIYASSGSALAVTIRLKLENLSKEAFDVQIHDVTSDLGDFAVRPERLLLAPEQSGEVDPMVSELGVTSDEIPVTVVLVAAGKSEKQIISVKNLFTPASEK
jgi:hypothetical protein